MLKSWRRLAPSALLKATFIFQTLLWVTLLRLHREIQKVADNQVSLPVVLFNLGAVRQVHYKPISILHQASVVTHSGAHFAMMASAKTGTNSFSNLAQSSSLVFWIWRTHWQCQQGRDGTRPHEEE